MPARSFAAAIASTSRASSPHRRRACARAARTRGRAARVPARERAFRDEAEQIRGAGRRDAMRVPSRARTTAYSGDPAAVARSARRARRRVSRSTKAAYAQPAMCALRGPTSTIASPSMRACCRPDAERANVERAQHRAVAADARRPHLRPPGANRAAIGARSADLDEDAVAEAFVEQRARDAGGGAREQREDRAALDLAHVHHAAVAAHDHQRRGNRGALDRWRGHACTCGSCAAESPR